MFVFRGFPHWCDGEARLGVDKGWRHDDNDGDGDGDDVANIVVDSDRIMLSYLQKVTRLDILIQCCIGR